MSTGVIHAGATGQAPLFGEHTEQSEGLMLALAGGAYPAHASLIDFQAQTSLLVPLKLGAHRLVLLAVEHPAQEAALTQQRREECVEAAHRMGAQTLRDALLQDLHMLPDLLARRARHVISEIGRALGAAEALRRGDMGTLGALLDASHASLRDEYAVSTTELDAAVASLKLAGALGARLSDGERGRAAIALMPPGTSTPAGVFELSGGHGAGLQPQTPLT